MVKMLLSLVPLMGTTIGSAIGVVERLYSKFRQEEDFLVAVATGILASINISLLSEAREYFPKARSLILLIFGIIVGVLFIRAMNSICSSTATRHHKLVWAMFIHNIPEGILIGIALANENLINAFALVGSITLQNLPDGLVVSMPLVSKLGKKKAFLAGVFSGIVEPVAAMIMVILAKDSGHIQMIEPLLIGFSISAISLITIELWKECDGKKLVISAMFINLVFMYVS